VENKLLFLLVEGPDDERFAETVLKELFLREYADVRIIRYAGKTNKYVNNLIKSANAMDANYILLTDFNSSPCITHRKNKILNVFRFCDESKIQVVVQEIEGWYVAGLNSQSQNNLKLSSIEPSDSITKEQFNVIIPKNFQRRDFLIELLKNFSFKFAIKQNTSLKYFAEKYNLQI
jgi:hypothetical protein